MYSDLQDRNNYGSRKISFDSEKGNYGGEEGREAMEISDEEPIRHKNNGLGFIDATDVPNTPVNE